MLRLGIGSYAYGWAVGVPGREPAQRMTALALVDRAVDVGVRVLQIGDNLPLHSLEEREIAALGEHADAAGVRIEVGARGIDAEHLRAYLRLATRFESDVLRLVIDTAESHPGEEEIAGALSEVMPEFDREGVRLAIENHDRFPARVLRRLMERIASPSIGICLDTANSLGCQEGIVHVAETLAPWIANVHVKDITVRRLEHLMGFHIEGAPAGEGDVDIPWLIELVRREVSRPVSVILELWPPPEPTLEATLAKEHTWVRSSVEYLRRLIPE